MEKVENVSANRFSLVFCSSTTTFNRSLRANHQRFFSALFLFHFSCDVVRLRFAFISSMWCNIYSSKRNEKSKTFWCFVKRTSFSRVVCFSFVVVFPANAVSVYFKPREEMSSKLHSPQNVRWVCVVMDRMSVWACNSMQSLHSVVLPSLADFDSTFFFPFRQRSKVCSFHWNAMEISSDRNNKRRKTLCKLKTAI